MATGDSDDLLASRNSSIFSLDATISEALKKLYTASLQLKKAIHFISPSIKSNQPCHLNPNTSFSYLLSLSHLVEDAVDILKVSNSVNDNGDGEVNNDAAINEALVQLEAASSRMNGALHFIHPNIISLKPFRLNTIKSYSFIKSLYRKVGEAVKILRKRIDESTQLKSKSPSKWKRLKKRCSQFRKSFTLPFLSCFGRSDTTQN